MPRARRTKREEKDEDYLTDEQKNTNTSKMSVKKDIKRPKLKHFQKPTIVNEPKAKDFIDSLSRLYDDALAFEGMRISMPKYSLITTTKYDHFINNILKGEESPVILGTGAIGSSRLSFHFPFMENPQQVVENLPLIEPIFKKALEMGYPSATSRLARFQTIYDFACKIGMPLFYRCYVPVMGIEKLYHMILKGGPYLHPIVKSIDDPPQSVE